jgi:hypothetical protein
MMLQIIPRDRNSGQASRRIGDEFILLRGIQREIPLLLLFGVLLGREANPINILQERKKKTQVKSMINNIKEEEEKTLIHTRNK